MKKMWKYLCMSMVVLAMTTTFVGGACRPVATETSIDIDGDGIVSGWETLFEKSGLSLREVLRESEIIDISSVDQLKDINDNNVDQIFRLTRDIDCNGQEISIDLGSSILYGNNRVIRNFKMASRVVTEKSNITATVRSLFFGGVAIYDLKIFAGKQTIELTNTNNSYLASLCNVSTIENVQVKGFWDIHRKKLDQLSANNTVSIALLSANLTVFDTELHENSSSIKTVSAIGKIDYSEDIGCVSVKSIGGIATRLDALSLLFDAVADVDIRADYEHIMHVGGASAISLNRMANVVTTGKIELIAFTSSTYAGGIVGENGKLAEIKYCTTDMQIEYSETSEISSNPINTLRMGGIVGANGESDKDAGGVIEYCVSDAKMNIRDTNSPVFVGGFVGVSNNGIYDTNICRGQINAVSVKSLKIANMIGFSKFGLITKALVTTSINIDNSQIASHVYLGMLTLFENFSLSANEYNAENSPAMSRILLTGTTDVYMLPDSQTTRFAYNYGLRNSYSFEKELEDGSIVRETRLADQFRNLAYNNFEINKYEDIDDTKESVALDPEITYPQSNGADAVSKKDNSSVYRVEFFVDDLGFKYGLNHNETDLTILELDKIKFNLTKEQYQTGYFLKQNNNAELTRFDHYFTECTLDDEDEMYSFLNHLVLSVQMYDYIPFVINNQFFQADEGNELTALEILCNNIEQIIRIMTPVDCSLWNDALAEVEFIEDASYFRYSFSDKSYKYIMLFDISSLKTSEIQDDYIIYLLYQKDVNRDA